MAKIESFLKINLTRVYIPYEVDWVISIPNNVGNHELWPFSASRERKFGPRWVSRIIYEDLPNQYIQHVWSGLSDKYSKVFEIVVGNH